MEFVLSKKETVETNWDVIIIGGGPGGLSAALYAARGGLKTLVIEKNFNVGGNIALTSLVEDYLGIPSINGEELTQQMRKHVEQFGVKILTGEEVVSTTFGSPHIVKTRNQTFNAKILIIATGTNPRKLNVEGENEYIGKGISYCAVCDAPFFKDKTVAVIGGGNSAFDESLYLTKFVKKLILIHRREEFRADKILQDRLMKKENVEFLLNKVVQKIEKENDEMVLTLFDKKKQSTTQLRVNGIFIYIGLIPNSHLFNVDKDDRGYIITNEYMETNVKNVFAVGDVRKSPLKQVITAVSDGAIAGHTAEEKIRYE